MSSAEEIAETLAPGTIVAGRYRVDRQLGQGGMGSVFLVQHVHTDERLALKLLHATVVKDAATLDRFRREARTPARIDSDHVVRVTDADVAPELDNVPFLVMEYLRGEDLEHLAGRRGAIPPAEVVLFLAQAGRALDKAHSLGIIHRDLKPENLFLTQREDGTPCVKILDFGIAKMTSSGGDVKEAGRLTATGQIFGTPLYMSPEQALAESDKISPQTDVWALGLIAHRLLTGKEFWTAQTLTHLVAQIAFEPIPPPSARGCALGPAYDEWFAKCCARKVDERFKAAGEAIAALATALRVTDSPSQLARMPVSVQIPTSSLRVSREHDAFAETSATEALTGPSSKPPLTRTQFSAEAAKPSRVPRTLGFAVGAGLVIVAGAIAAWKYASPAGANGTAGPGASVSVTASSEAPRPTSPKTADPTPTGGPMVTPSAEVSAGTTPATTTAPSGPAPKHSASTGSGTPSSKPSVGTGPKPSSTPSATASTTATTPATTAPTTTATKADPLGSRH